MRTRISSGRLTIGLAKWGPSLTAQQSVPAWGWGQGVSSSAQPRPGARSSEEQALEQREPLCDWLAPGWGLWQEGTQGSQRCSCSLLCTFTAVEEEERQALGAGWVWTPCPWRMSSVCPARGGEREQKVWSF